MTDQFLLTKILKNTNSGKDYKNFILVSKLWYLTLNKLFPEGGHFVNHLTTLLKLFPDKNWNYLGLMHNPNITYDYILSNSRFDQNSIMSYIVYNPNIFENSKIMKIINDDLDKYAHVLSYNKKLPFRMVAENINLHWYHAAMTYNGVDIEFIKNNPYINWNWTALSKSSDVTWDMVKNNPRLPWNYVAMLANPNITLEIVLNNRDIFKDIRLFLANPNAYKSPDFIKTIMLSNSDLIANYAPWDIIKQYPELIDNERFERNKNIPPEMSIKHAHTTYFECANLSTEFIRSIVNLKARHLSKCPTLTWRIVADNPDANWDFYMMTFNHFGKKVH